MDLTEKEISSKILFRGKILNLRYDIVRLPNGQEASREIVEHMGGVGIVAVTGEGKLLMVRQYRRPYDEVILEIPAGKLNEGEDPEECGRRELLEETGCTAKNFDYLGSFYATPGFSNETIYLYLATGLARGEMHLDADEFLNLEEYSLQEVENMIDSGEIHDGKTVIGFYRAQKRMRDLDGC